MPELSCRTHCCRNGCWRLDPASCLIDGTDVLMELWFSLPICWWVWRHKGLAFLLSRCTCDFWPCLLVPDLTTLPKPQLAALMGPALWITQLQSSWGGRALWIHLAQCVLKQGHPVQGAQACVQEASGLQGRRLDKILRAKHGLDAPLLCLLQRCEGILLMRISCGATCTCTPLSPCRPDAYRVFLPRRAVFYGTEGVWLKKKARDFALKILIFEELDTSLGETFADITKCLQPCWSLKQAVISCTVWLKNILNGVFNWFFYCPNGQHE